MSVEEAVGDVPAVLEPGREHDELEIVGIGLGHDDGSFLA
jgi:hypothetical protein